MFNPPCVRKRPRSSRRCSGQKVAPPVNPDVFRGDTARFHPTLKASHHLDLSRLLRLHRRPPTHLHACTSATLFFSCQIQCDTFESPKSRKNVPGFTASDKHNQSH